MASGLRSRPLSQLLQSDVPGSMRASVMLFTGISIQDGWKELEYCVRTGATRLPACLSPIRTRSSKWPKILRPRRILTKRWPHSRRKPRRPRRGCFDFSACQTLADIGGGNGSLLVGILKANPQLRGIVFDLPQVIERAKHNIETSGLADRCQVVAGSFFDAWCKAPTFTCSSTSSTIGMTNVRPPF